MNLQDFCEQDADFRPALSRPVNFEGHAYATDGKIAMRVTADPAYQEYDALFHKSWPIQVRDWLAERIPSAKLSPVPDYQEPELGKCDECAGTGKWEDEENPICQECGGSGETDWVPVRFGNLGVNFHYLKKLRALPGLKIDLTGSGAVQIPFVFDGGEGLLMSMKISRKDA